MEPDKSKPENNPWYLLATLYGEAESADDEVHARNRTAWNRFMASELTEDARDLLIEEDRCSAEELIPFSAEELADVEKRFSERHRQATGSTTEATPPLPNLKRDRVDFSNLEFNRPFSAEGFFFPTQTNVETVESWPTNFSGAIFSDETYFSGVTFFGRANFRGATFSDQARADFRGTVFSDSTDFSGATFSGFATFGYTIFRAVNFSRATFSDLAVFSGTTFSGLAVFSGTTFSDEIYFWGATFSGRADFSGATFSDETYLWGATFSDETYFSGATFGKGTLFVNATMKGPTSFENATFSTAPPQFSGATLHEGTVWRGVSPWPLPSDQKDAGPFVDAYERLKLEMDRLKKHEDELHFFALELQSRHVLEGNREQQVSELKIFGWTVFLVPPLKIIFEEIKTLSFRKLFGRFSAQPLLAIQARTIRVPRSLHGLAIALYGWLSDYGRSYVRPLYGLLITIAIGVLPFWWHLSGFWQAVGISFGNTFGVLGFRKDLIDPQVLTCLPGLLKVIAAAQTIVGVVLLFLFGLAIRNRFRMK